MSVQTAPATRPAGAEPSVTAPGPDGQAARLTLRAFAGSALAILPLLQLLSDTSWLIQAWISMAIVIVPAAFLRLWRRPSALHLVPGIVLLVGYLTRVYLPDHAWLGVVPTRSSWTDFRADWTALGHTIHDSAAPLNSTGPVRLYLSIGLVALAVVIDLLVVELHRPALAGVPLLLIFTLSGAIPREAVSWLWFALAGAGYLLILSSRSVDELAGWGRVVARPERTGRARLSSGLSGRRIGIAAVLIAIVVPFIVPLGSVNLIANALHNGQVGTGGNGKGSTGVVIDPLAVLRGELTRGTPVNLFTVNVTGDGAKSAFYLRTAVLENYTGKAWVQGSEATTSPLSGSLVVAPATAPPTVDTSQFTATVTVSKLGGTAPVFATPTQVGGSVPKTWLWDPRYGLVSGDVTSGLRFTETVAQPDPSIAALEASVAVRRSTSTLNGPNNSAITDNLSTDKVPSQVADLVTTITAGKTTPYDKARALSSYFTDPANGFIYSLQTKSGESGNDLVDFLTTGKAGFCQQYAAALGVMLRVAGIPARVVLGYTHPAPDATGKFVVTSDDAHAWVEAYFTGIGWVPFDPTPLTGVDAARAVALPWAPHPAAVGGSNDEEKARADAQAAAAAAGDPAATTTSNATSTNRASGGANTSWLVLAAIVLAVLLAAMVPAVLRIRRRRQRLHRARLYGPEPLWDELADTVRDLGFGWSDARTMRQVTVWLGELLPADQSRTIGTALASLADAVERERYAAIEATTSLNEGGGWRQGVQNLVDVRSALLSAVSARTRWRARLLPASLLRSAGRAASAPRDGGNAREAVSVR